MISDEIISVVADIGNLYTRVGFTGDDFPRWNTYTKCTDNFQFGDESLDLRPTKDIMQPLDFDLYEKMVRESYKRLGVQPKDFSLLLANNFQSKQDLQKITEIIFESIEIPNFFTIRNAVLATFSAGRPTALVLDIGAYSTTAVAVHDGYTLLKTQIQAPIGGETLNEDFKKYVENQQDNNFKQQNLIRDIKQTLLNYEPNEGGNQYDLPDGSSIKLSSNEILNIAEKLFQQKDGFKGVNHMLIDVVNNSHVDLKQTLCNTVLATGGTSNINGFLQKLNTSLSNVVSPMCKVKLVQYPSQQNRYHSVFIGGSILASLSSFQSMWVGKSEYQESGKFSIVERKCPM